jgi:aminoglycoside phosphotransferase (APT) family kinase protein
MKYGRFMQPIEGHNMLFVAQRTAVPVPRVFAIYQQRREDEVLITYILMEYIPGTTLLDAWGSLDYDRKARIARTLRLYFDQLRLLQNPEGYRYHGSIAGGPPLDYMFTETDHGPTEATTTFWHESQLIDCFLRIYALEGGELMAHKARYYRQVLPQILYSNRPPVFTHNDFQRKNVMLRPDRQLVSIDWEFAS